jgi:hypothetical protein
MIQNLGKVYKIKGGKENARIIKEHPMMVTASIALVWSRSRMF